MIRPTRESLENVTSIAGMWRRRCNGYPEEGILENAAGLRVVLVASEKVGVYPDGTIEWTGPAGRFTAEPVVEADAEA